jgi:hypothetical protein
MTKSANFTVIMLSGRPQFYEDVDYFTILSGIAQEYGSAGGNWDRPNTLLLNGKVVVPTGLADIAWNYGNRNRELHEGVRFTMRSEFQPDWMKTE